MLMTSLFLFLSVSSFLDPMGEEYHIRRASWIPALMVVVGIDPVTQHL